MKEIIFFDVDDTLVDSQTHLVPESTKHALLYLSKYYDMAIATGRSLPSLMETQIHKLIPWDAFVCNNGQIVYDQNYEILFQQALDPNDVQAILDIAKQRKEPVLLATPNWHRIGESNAYMETAHAFFHIPIPKDIHELYEDVIMLLVYGPLGFDYAPYKQVEGLDFLPGQSTYCDIVKAGFEKSIGIQKVLDHVQVDSYLAFGDSNNDLGMLQQARIAVVLGQGTTAAKALADFVTKPVYEDGIAYALEVLKL